MIGERKNQFWKGGERGGRLIGLLGRGAMTKRSFSGGDHVDPFCRSQEIGLAALKEKIKRGWKKEKGAREVGILSARRGKNLESCLRYHQSPPAQETGGKREA